MERKGKVVNKPGKRGFYKISGKSNKHKNISGYGQVQGGGGGGVTEVALFIEKQKEQKENRKEENSLTSISSKMVREKR